MKFTTLIPTKRNDGTSVSNAELQDILYGIWQAFGGCTTEGSVTGHWIDEQDGQHYSDESWKVTVACDSARLADAERTVIEIGRRLDQKVMYFEVRDFDGIRFLKIPAL